ncbi:hypothetical protein [Cupriavidus sp. YAF13]
MLTKYCRGPALYLALVAAAFVAHACAMERDEQATPATTATRSV